MLMEIDVVGDSEFGDAIADEVEAVHELAMAYVVDCPEALTAAASELNNVARLRREIETARKRITKPLDDAKREVMRQAHMQTEPLEEAERALKRAISDYQELIRARHAEEQRLARVAVEAEAARMLAEAEVARAEGDDALASSLDVAVSVMPEPAVAPLPKTSGISVRETWRAEITDVTALLRGVLDGTVPPGAVEPNMQMLNQSARAMRGALNWPGVRVVRETNVAATGAR